MGRHGTPPLSTEEALKQLTREARETLKDLRAAKREAEELLTKTVRRGVQEAVEREIKALLREVHEFVRHEKLRFTTETAHIVRMAERDVTRQVEIRLAKWLGVPAGETEVERLGTIGMMEKADVFAPHNAMLLANIKDELQKAIDSKSDDVEGVALVLKDGQIIASQVLSASDSRA